MTEAQKNLLALVAENVVDYLREKYHVSNLNIDKRNYEDLKETIQEFEIEENAQTPADGLTALILSMNESLYKALQKHEPFTQADADLSVALLAYKGHYDK